MRKLLLVVISLLFCINLHAKIDNSIVKIYTTAYYNDWMNPWRQPSLSSSTGSCCIIDGNKILTNAHNVSNQIFMKVKKAGDSKKYPAKLLAVGHDCDLAILTVEDESFFEGTSPIKIGNLPKRKELVTVYGFPVGGDEISLTQGIISRIESHPYAHSKAELLTIQIDAAINPGNSGGPVIKDSKIVGIAFQGLRDQAEGIGYMIPTPIIKHFLEDSEKKTYGGFPDLLIRWQGIENPALRESLKVPENKSGILITDISFKSPTKNILQKQDVLTAVNDTSITNDGTISFDKNTRTSWTDLVSSNFIDNKITAKIFRDGKEMTLEIPLSKRIFEDRLVPYTQYDTTPTYYVMAGLVFQPVNGNLAGSYKYVDLSNLPILYQAQLGKISEEKKELVILSSVLPDPINKGYDSYRNLIVQEVNGKKIGSMEDLKNAFETNENKYHTIITDNEIRIVLDREKAKTAHQEILGKYHISFDRSENLR